MTVRPEPRHAASPRTGRDSSELRAGTQHGAVAAGRGGPAGGRGVRRSARRQQSRRLGNSGLVATAFLLPSFVFYGLFLLVPLVLTFLLSFTSWQGFSYDDIQFNHGANYSTLMHDPVFLKSLAHNGAFLLTTVVAKVVLAFLLALAVRRAFPLNGLFRGIFIVPSTLSLVVVGVLLKSLLDPNSGIANPLLRAVGLGGLTNAWLGNPSLALPILIALDVWVGFGLSLFVFLAGLASLPGDVSEAARVDGARSWQETLYITIPLLAPTIGLVVLLAAIDSLKVFATVYVATGGGPNHSTEVLSTWAFFQAFTGNQVGYGSAIMSVLLVGTLVLAFFYVRANVRRENA
jgi:raffinose/stachyose/melibiose transport system permease protein